jgi:hypothetical protein
MATAQKSAIYTVQSVILKVAYIANPNLSSKSGTGGLTMAEYIDREALRKVLENWRDAHADVDDEQGCGLLEDVIWEVDAQPAADVAPVVRCKDCKHYRNYPNGLCYLHTEPKTNARGYSGDAVCVEPDDFCSYGEKKDGGDAEG